MGKLKEAHANNDKISAVRIGKAYLAGTAKTVWVPDPKTQERRDWFHAHRKAVKRSTQMRNRLLSYLSDNGVRLKKGTPLAKGKAAEEQLGKTQDWTPRQWQVIEGMLMELRHADEQRSHWRSLIAQEVLGDPQLLSIVRLCGVREKVAFALGALIGDIARFAEPRKLVKYIGLNPAFDDSGQGQWRGGIIGGHGRKDLRSLLIESAQSILRSKDRWRNGAKNCCDARGKSNWWSQRWPASWRWPSGI
jgi:transposase